MSRSLATLLTIAVLLSACGRPDSELRLITPRLPIDKEIAEQFAALLDEESSVDVVLVPSPDINMTALDALEADYADIALAGSNEVYRHDIATVLPLYSNILHIAYKAEFDVRDGEEITATRGLLGASSVYAGPPGSP